MTRAHGYVAVIEGVRERPDGSMESLGWRGLCTCGHRTEPRKQKLTAQRNLVTHIQSARTRRGRKKAAR